MQVNQELTYPYPSERDGLLFVTPVWSKLSSILSQPNEIARMRVYDIIIKVSTKLPHLVERFARLGVWDGLLQEVKIDDVLLQLNAVELFSQLAEIREGFVYLRDQKVLAELDEYLGEVASSSSSSFLLPGFIKFFGVVSEKHDLEFFQHFPNFKSNLSAFLQSNDVGHKILGVETMGHLCSNPDKKISLVNLNGIVDLFVKSLGRLTESGSTVTEVKVRALNVMQTLGIVHTIPSTFEEVKNTLKMMNN